MLLETFGAEELGPDRVLRVRQRSRRQRAQPPVSEQCSGSQPRHAGGLSAMARMGDLRARSLGSPRATRGGSPVAPAHCPATIRVQFKTMSPRSVRADGAVLLPWFRSLFRATRPSQDGSTPPPEALAHPPVALRSCGSLAPGRSRNGPPWRARSPTSQGGSRQILELGGHLQAANLGRRSADVPPSDQEPSERLRLPALIPIRILLESWATTVRLTALALGSMIRRLGPRTLMA